MDARLRTIVRYFQSCPDPCAPELEGLAHELHPHIFVCSFQGSSNEGRELVFERLGGRLERQLRRSCGKESVTPLTPEILGPVALRALEECATSSTALWLREAATTSDQTGRVIELAAVFIRPNQICGGILYSPTAWFFADRPVLKVRPLAGKPPRAGAPPLLRSVPRP